MVEARASYTTAQTCLGVILIAMVTRMRKGLVVEIKHPSANPTSCMSVHFAQDTYKSQQHQDAYDMTLYSLRLMHML